MFGISATTLGALHPAVVLTIKEGCWKIGDVSEKSHKNDWKIGKHALAVEPIYLSYQAAIQEKLKSGFQVSYIRNISSKPEAPLGISNNENQ